jgi:hypothetical protein
MRPSFEFLKRGKPQHENLAKRTDPLSQVCRAELEAVGHQKPVGVTFVLLVTSGNNREDRPAAMWT